MGNETALAERAVAPPEEPPPAPFPASRPVRVAFLPLALAAFVILAFVMAAWTSLAAAT